VTSRPRQARGILRYNEPGAQSFIIVVIAQLRRFKKGRTAEIVCVGTCIVMQCLKYFSLYVPPGFLQLRRCSMQLYISLVEL